MSRAIETWHEYLRTRDVAILNDLLADDVVFESPVVFTPQRGTAVALLGSEHFEYRDAWYSPKSAVLEFVTEIDGVTINGVDLITWNDAQQITHFKVMVRPLQALNALHRKMGELLAAHAST